ncbi:MAG: beta-xylosidase, partial [Acidobacteriota bacterium]|nr:beta-xylosidase [Acidobacteriota bacterium]
AYTAWLAMGSPQHPDATQYARLQAAGQLELLTSPQWLDVRDGTITLTTSLPHESLSLLRLTWQ